MYAYKKISILAAAALLLGCGHYLIPGRFQPLEVAQQQTDIQGSSMKILDDGTVTFVQNRLEVSVRPMTDEEINRQYPAESTNASGPADELPSNPFTYGNWIDPRTGEAPQRLSIFKITVKNYEYPKVKFDPLMVTVESANGRLYYPWGSYDVEEYFRRFPLAFNGLGYLRYNERRGLYNLAKYPDDEFCFSGQEVEGYVIFSKIHTDVAEIAVEIPEFGLRYNFRDEPIETIDLHFRFKRDIKKVKNIDKVAAN
ncbi:MAG: hypothetical protein OXH63_06225 [Gemmatimonadetes bacterium]|nr:hypothetical protein [Gemmatimonadota bacterium]